MDSEHNERQIAFILEHQAKFSAWLEKLQERDGEWEARHAQSEARHAQSEARHAQSEARHAQWEARMEKVDRQIEQLVGFAGTLRDALLALTHHVERHDQQSAAHDQQIADHVQQIADHVQQMAAIDRGLAEMVERGKETDARLAALSIIVERHVSGHH